MAWSWNSYTSIVNELGTGLFFRRGGYGAALALRAASTIARMFSVGTSRGFISPVLKRYPPPG